MVILISVLIALSNPLLHRCCRTVAVVSAERSAEIDGIKY